MSSSSSSKTESEQHTTASSTSNHSRMKYTLERKWMLLKDFKEQDKDYIQFASENKIPRQTFKHWIDEADRLEDKVQHFPARRFRTRESSRPELDRILIAWYNDMRTNSRTYPITRALILDKAIHFQKLLDHLTDNRPIQATDYSTADQREEPEDNAKLFEPSDILDEDLQKYEPHLTYRRLQQNPQKQTMKFTVSLLTVYLLYGYPLSYTKQHIRVAALSTIITNAMLSLLSNSYITLPSLET